MAQVRRRGDHVASSLLLTVSFGSQNSSLRNWQTQSRLEEKKCRRSTSETLSLADVTVRSNMSSLLTCARRQEGSAPGCSLRRTNHTNVASDVQTEGTRKRPRHRDKLWQSRLSSLCMHHKRQSREQE